MLKDTLAFDSDDENRFTGTETRPNEIVAVPIVRAGMIVGWTGGRTNRSRADQSGPVEGDRRAPRWQVVARLAGRMVFVMCKAGPAVSQTLNDSTPEKVQGCRQGSRAQGRGSRVLPVRSEALHSERQRALHSERQRALGQERSDPGPLDASAARSNLST